MGINICEFSHGLIFNNGVSVSIGTSVVFSNDMILYLAMYQLYIYGYIDIYEFSEDMILYQAM